MRPEHLCACRTARRQYARTGRYFSRQTDVRARHKRFALSPCAHVQLWSDTYFIAWTFPKHGRRRDRAANTRRTRKFEFGPGPRLRRVSVVKRRRRSVHTKSVGRSCRSPFARFVFFFFNRIRYFLWRVSPDERTPRYKSPFARSPINRFAVSVILSYGTVATQFMRVHSDGHQPYA